MAQVPQRYQAEPGARFCGESYQQTITVTGEIPGRGGYGADRKHVVPRVAKLPTTPNFWSRRSGEEAAFRERVEAAASHLLTEIADARGKQAISADEAASLRYLVDLARSNLARVDELYAYWDGAGVHPDHGTVLPSFEGDVSDWPLPEGDRIEQHVAQCADVRGDWVEERALVGTEVETIRWYYCPGSVGMGRRAADRASILRNLVDAAKAVRCAQWGLWRLVLVGEALAAWEEEYGGLGFVPGVGAPTPAGWGVADGLVADVPTGVDPADIPGPSVEPVPAWWAPDPEDLPELGIPEPTDTTLPPDVGPGLGEAPTVFEKKILGVPAPLAVGGAALALYLLTR